jgi:hypothetical protein
MAAQAVYGSIVERSLMPEFRGSHRQVITDLDRQSRPMPSERKWQYLQRLLIAGRTGYAWKRPA